MLTAEGQRGNRMVKIAIIGCGQIGSRHLQSLSFLEEEAIVYLIDPSVESKKISYDRFLDIAGDSSSITVELNCNIEDIDGNLDVAIVSTSSFDRFKNIKDLLNCNHPKYMILEKFLFQKEEDYETVASLISKNNIKTYVNQWVSGNYAFNRVSSLLGKIYNLEITVHGNDWGLACNSVHFIDYFDFLTGRADLKIEKSTIDAAYRSKRMGYYEFHGVIDIVNNNKDKLKLISSSGNCGSIFFDIINNGKKFYLELTQGSQLIFKDCNGNVVNYHIPYQSSVTHRIVQDLLITNECNLVEYSRSSYQHNLVLPIFDKYLRDKEGWCDSGCPIT